MCTSEHIFSEVALGYQKVVFSLDGCSSMLREGCSFMPCSLGKVVKVISNFLRELFQLYFLRGTTAVQVLPGCEGLTHAYV